MEKEKSFSPSSAAEFAEFQVNRNFASLCRNLLHLLEDIRDNRTDFDYSFLRKKILDHGNEAKREILSQLEMFKIDYR